MLMHGQTLPTARATALTQPWRLPPRGLAVFHGEHHAPRLSHSFCRAWRWRASAFCFSMAPTAPTRA